MYHKGFLSEEHSDPENKKVIHVYRTDLQSSFVSTSNSRFNSLTDLE